LGIKESQMNTNASNISVDKRPSVLVGDPVIPLAEGWMVLGRYGDFRHTQETAIILSEIIRAREIEIRSHRGAKC
jgi:hypothetical protein